MAPEEMSTLRRLWTKFMGEEAAEHAHDDQPRAAAGTMMVAPDGRVLFTRRKDTRDHAGSWAFPAGMVEEDESPQAAALREAHEEVGPNCGLEPRGMIPVDRRVLEGVDFTTFVAPVNDAFQPKLNEEHDLFVWAHPKDAPKPLHPGVDATLQKLATDPPVSEAQRRAMWAAATGKSDLDIPRSVGKEFAKSDPGGRLPERKGEDDDLGSRFELTSGGLSIVDKKTGQLYDTDEALRVLFAGPRVLGDAVPVPSASWKSPRVETRKPSAEDATVTPSGHGLGWIPSKESQVANWKSPKFAKSNVTSDYGTSEGARKAAATRKA